MKDNSSADSIYEEIVWKEIVAIPDIYALAEMLLSEYETASEQAQREAGMFFDGEKAMLQSEVRLYRKRIAELRELDECRA